MRTFYLLFIPIVVLCLSCHEQHEQKKIEDITPDSSTKMSPDIPDETEPTHVITPEEFVNTPFVLSVHGDEQWDIQEILKPHDNTIDTLQTLTFKHSVVHVKNHHFVDAVLHDQEISLVHDIHVGMSRKDFEHCFSHLAPHKNHPHVEVTDKLIEMGCCEKDDHPPHWKFQFNNDLLTEIRYDLDYVSAVTHN